MSKTMVAQMVKNICLQCRCSTGFNPWVEKIPWRREWLPTPVFLPGEFYGEGSLVGYSPRGSQKLDTTKPFTHTHTHIHTKWEGFSTRKKDAVCRRGKGCQADNYNRYSPQKTSRSNLSSLIERQKEERGEGWGANCETHFFFFPCLISCFPPSFILFNKSPCLLETVGTGISDLQHHIRGF